MVRGWEAPGGPAGVAMAEEKERACLPEAMRSCPTMGGCDLTSPGTEELPPHRWGMTPAAITRSPLRALHSLGPGGGPPGAL